ncbi:CbtA family protein [Streptomyces benahoarensis]|uniref:CbtA family protein n=1 Tax=Streptomyces benahoarensis TaxID=2595054 RepID=A0A553ZMP7_9ACTN|nr:CbtA family protein [Streptomyces benahoarensis]TSB42751.1 CbtA family protein [Streptomyces benahoarensis]
MLRRRPDGIGQRAYLFMTFALGAAMLLPAYGKRWVRPRMRTLPAWPTGTSRSCGSCARCTSWARSPRPPRHCT